MRSRVVAQLDHDNQQLGQRNEELGTRIDDMRDHAAQLHNRLAAAIDLVDNLGLSYLQTYSAFSDELATLTAKISNMVTEIGTLAGSL